MMIRKFLFHSICCLPLLLLSVSAIAGNLYRFENEDGVKTLSRSLPPEAAQQGYDILDGNTMRLIERVPPAPTEAEIAEMKAREAEEKERQRQQAEAEKQAQIKRDKQRHYDRTLLTTYPTEADLMAARDKDINYRQEQIRLLNDKLPKLQQRLENVQQQAAKKELSGGQISKNMQKRLDAAQQEITVSRDAIAQYRAEIEELSEQYQQDLERLRQLRGTSSAQRN